MRFNIRPHGRKEYVTVMIFPTKAKMYAFRKKFAKVTGEEVGHMDFLGLFTGYERIVFSNGKIKLFNGEEKRMNDIGKVLLCSGYCHADIVSHELLHAAMHYERLIHGNKIARFGTNIGVKEERLAHTLSDLLRGFYSKVKVTER